MKETTMGRDETRSAEESLGGIKRREFLRHTALGAVPLTYALGGGRAAPVSRRRQRCPPAEWAAWSGAHHP